MRLFEKHKNGAVIDMDGEPERISSILMGWREYQDSKDSPRQPVGFTRNEEEKHD